MASRSNGLVLAACFMALLVVVRASPPPETSRDCVVNMLTRAGITRSTARKYAKYLALADARPEDLGTASRETLTEIGITNISDQIRIVSCYSPFVSESSRPENCQNYQQCDRNSTCTLLSRTSKPRFVCKQKDACDEGSCLNGGFCKSAGANYTCDCTAGYRGRRCEEKWLTMERSDAQFANTTKSVQDNVEALKRTFTSAVSSIRGLMEHIFNALVRIDPNVAVRPSKPTSRPTTVVSSVAATIVTTVPTTVLPTTERVTTRRRIRVARTDYELSVPHNVNWYSARRSCTSRGGDLAVARNYEEHTKLAQLMSGSNYDTSVWLGATDHSIEGRWRWTTGEAVAFSRWNSGEPNNDYAGHEEDCMQFVRGSWNDLPCDRPIHGFICQYTRYSYKYV